MYSAMYITRSRLLKRLGKERLQYVLRELHIGLYFIAKQSLLPKVPVVLMP